VLGEEAEGNLCWTLKTERKWSIAQERGESKQYTTNENFEYLLIIYRLILIFKRATTNIIVKEFGAKSE
jgi:hypothetical protein